MGKITTSEKKEMGGWSQSASMDQGEVGVVKQAPFVQSHERVKWDE